MLKKEIIYREILRCAIEEKKFNFQQLNLSRKFNFSLSTVNNALKPLVIMGAVEVFSRGFKLVDTKKAILYWATIRNMDRDIIYSTRANYGVIEIEKSVPSSALFTGYTAYKFLFKNVPADYSEVYFYIPVEELEEIKLRFPVKRGPPNIYVLKGDAWLDKNVTTAQIFVDIWNLKSWYAKEFIHALEGKLGL